MSGHSVAGNPQDELRGHRRLSGDSGQVAGIEVIPFGILTFVIGSLLITNAWAVVDAKAAVSAAAREAARSYVEAPDQDTASTSADAAFRDAISANGRNPGRARLVLEHEDGAEWSRCTRITATVHYQLPALTLPWIGGYGHPFDIRATRSEVVDPYRANLAGDTTC